MKQITNIALHEFNRFFKSSTAWIILAVVQFLLAIFFFVLLSQYVAAPQLAVQFGLTEFVVANVLQISGIILLLVTPFITMRLVSDERRLGTIKLLYSSPVTITELVLGKFIGVALFYIVALLLISLLPLCLSFGTHLDIGQIIATFLGLLLLVLAFSAIGLFVSSLTSHPNVAAIGTFGILFILWIINLAGNNASETTAAIFNYASLIRHYQNFVNGIFNSVDVIYYLLVITVFISLTIWRLDAERVHG